MEGWRRRGGGIHSAPATPQGTRCESYCSAFLVNSFKNPHGPLCEVPSAGIYPEAGSIKK